MVEMSTGLRHRAVDFLLGEVPAAQRVASEIESSPGSGEAWTGIIELCADWKVLPRLRERLGESEARLPAHCRARLQQLLSQDFVYTARCVNGGADALGLLEAWAIPCAAFKGLAAVALLYPGPERRRTLHDVDILIRGESLRPALEVLEANGYHRSLEGPLDEYIAFVQNSPGSAGNEAVSMSNHQGATIDLHWRLGRLDPAVLLGDIRRCVVLNKPVPVIAPVHSLLLTAHHSLRNDFVADEMMRDLLDFSAWLDLLDSDAERSCVVATAREWGLAGAVLAMERIVSMARGGRPTVLAPIAASGDLRNGTDLAELYFHQLQFGPLNTDLVYLADPNPLFQVLAGAASGWSRYRAIMKDMEILNGSAELTLRGRLRRLAAAARRLPARRWRQVRTLAAAKQDVSG